MSPLENNKNIKSENNLNLNNAPNATKTNCLTRLFQKCLAPNSKLLCFKITAATLLTAGAALPIALFFINPALLGLGAAISSLTCLLTGVFLINQAVKQEARLPHSHTELLDFVEIN